MLHAQRLNQSNKRVVRLTAERTWRHWGDVTLRGLKCRTVLKVPCSKTWCLSFVTLVEWPSLSLSHDEIPFTHVPCASFTNNYNRNMAYVCSSHGINEKLKRFFISMIFKRWTLFEKYTRLWNGPVVTLRVIAGICFVTNKGRRRT